MKKFIRLIMEKAPDHYPPSCVEDVDFSYDERHPWRRRMRKNSPMIAFVGTLLVVLWLYTYFRLSNESLGFSTIITIVLVYQLYADLLDDERNGHLRPNQTGDYWRARKQYLDYKCENEPNA